MVDTAKTTLPVRLLTTGEAARRLEVHEQTVRRYEREGVLTGVRYSGRGPGHPVRFFEHQVEALRRRGLGDGADG